MFYPLCLAIQSKFVLFSLYSILATVHNAPSNIMVNDAARNLDENDSARGMVHLND